MKTRKRALLAEIETAYGTDPNPTGAANAILISDLTVTPMENETIDLDYVRAYLGNSEQLPTAISAKLEYTVDLAGSGAAGTPPAWGPLIRACGFTQTINAGVEVVYTLHSNDGDSLTQYCNYDGVLHRLLGSRGNVALDLTAKGRPTLRFSFHGLFLPVIDAALPAQTLSGWVKPVPVNAVNTTGLTVHAHAGAKMQSLSIDVGNSVVFRSLVGGESVLIADRKPKGNIVIEANSVATKDWYTIARNATLGPLAIQHGQVAGNIVEIEAPAVQLLPPTYSDMDGIAMLNMGLSLVPGAAGNDELVITVR